VPTCQLNLQVLHTSRQAQAFRVVVHRHHPAATSSDGMIASTHDTEDNLPCMEH
jgi:hypothetical protein